MVQSRISATTLGKDCIYQTRILKLTIAISQHAWAKQWRRGGDSRGVLQKLDRQGTELSNVLGEGTEFFMARL